MFACLDVFAVDVIEQFRKLGALLHRLHRAQNRVGHAGNAARHGVAFGIRQRKLQCTEAAHRRAADERVLAFGADVKIGLHDARHFLRHIGEILPAALHIRIIIRQPRGHDDGELLSRLLQKARKHGVADKVQMVALIPVQKIKNAQILRVGAAFFVQFVHARVGQKHAQLLFKAQDIGLIRKFKQSHLPVFLLGGNFSFEKRQIDPPPFPSLTLL